METSHQLESLIVSLGVEDHYGLYELVGRSGPTSSREEQVAAVRAALKSLISRNLINLYSCKMPLDSPVLVPSEVLNTVLDNPRAWLPPNEGEPPYYCFLATDEGDAKFQAGEFNSL